MQFPGVVLFPFGEDHIAGGHQQVKGKERELVPFAFVLDHVQKQQLPFPRLSHLALLRLPCRTIQPNSDRASSSFR